MSCCASLNNSVVARCRRCCVSCGREHQDTDPRGAPSTPPLRRCPCRPQRDAPLRLAAASLPGMRPSLRRRAEEAAGLRRAQGPRPSPAPGTHEPPGDRPRRWRLARLAPGFRQRPVSRGEAPGAGASRERSGGLIVEADEMGATWAVSETSGGSGSRWTPGRGRSSRWSPVTATPVSRPLRSTCGRWHPASSAVLGPATTVTGGAMTRMPARGSVWGRAGGPHPVGDFSARVSPRRLRA